jgi:MGT family glycosyltransferase
VWESLFEGAKYAQPQLEKILADTDPDAIVEDNVNCFPALMTHGAPWVRIVSCNPLEIKDPGLPPPFSGLPVDDPSGWDAFRAEYERTHRELWQSTNDWVIEQGAPPLPPLEFIHSSAHLNLYLFPQAADYPRSQPLAETWHRLESSVRDTEEPFEIPSELRDRRGALIYLSLGSLGSADVDLMKRLIEMLAGTPHRYIVSKGPRAAEFDLADNMWGEDRLPQTSIIPLTDLVITHGGNNTTTEALHFGKPMVVLPLFWDQYDNAQRVQEVGCGVRLDTYRFAERELTESLNGLLADSAMRRRMEDQARRIRRLNGKSRAADLIERVGERGPGPS